ncbi:hypothetical protein KC352_g22657 [Hortaea werneckii]|nr:hypothetical protein KC352_g22657 [Hortaea werneckii]
MSDPSNDMNQPLLNLTPEEKRAFSYLFAQADTDNLGVLTGERAVSFFERTHIPPQTLGEIWQIADTENRGLLTKAGFCMVLRLIGHVQQQPGREVVQQPADKMLEQDQAPPAQGSRPRNLYKRRGADRGRSGCRH